MKAAPQRLIGVIERARVRWLLGVDLAPFPPVPQGGGLWQQLKRHLGDGAGWRGLLYAPVAFGWGIASFVVIVALWSTGLSIVMGVAAALAIARSPKLSTRLLDSLFMSPLGLPVLIFLLVRSTIQHRVARAVTWKGRTYNPNLR